MYKTQLEIDEELSVRAKTIKLLEENTGINLNDLRLGNRFLDMTSKVPMAKEKIDKIYIIKIKSLCIQGHNKVKRQPTK